MLLCFFFDIECSCVALTGAVVGRFEDHLEAAFVHELLVPSSARHGAINRADH